VGLLDLIMGKKQRGAAGPYEDAKIYNKDMFNAAQALYQKDFSPVDTNKIAREATPTPVPPDPRRIGFNFNPNPPSWHGGGGPEGWKDRIADLLGPGYTQENVETLLASLRSGDWQPSAQIFTADILGAPTKFAEAAMLRDLMDQGFSFDDAKNVLAMEYANRKMRNWVTGWFEQAHPDLMEKYRAWYMKAEEERQRQRELDAGGAR